MLTHRMARWGCLALGLAALAVAVALGRPATGDPGRPQEEALLRARSAAVRNMLDLARDGTRFLVLEPQKGTLTLFDGAVPLRVFTVLEVEAGERRLGVGRGSPREDWRTARWEASRLEPPVHREHRTLVSDSVEPPDPSGAVDWIPPTPDEAVPTPPRFLIHFEAGLGVEVVAAGTDPTAARTGIWNRVEHRVRRFFPGNWDRYRIRVVMPFAEAGALYRSLPDSAALVAIIPQ
ncbi:MAG TPA: hypothetical protein VLA43_19835 [Longimicrobiales bacterium]|nr:hypothetical protein [Longimicrobiales bacterium]